MHPIPGHRERHLTPPAVPRHDGATGHTHARRVCQVACFHAFYPYMPPPGQWRHAFSEAAALGLRVAVVDTNAHMLACANLKAHVICTEPALLGDRWHEFVDPVDLPAVKRWFAALPDDFPAAASNGAIHYRQLCQLDERPVLCRITLVKVWVGDAWLAYGALRRLRARPQLHW
jgi:hypothetical protein